MTTVTCTGPDEGTIALGNTVAIDLDPSGTVQCRYANTDGPGTLEIVKDTKLLRNLACAWWWTTA